MLDEMKEVDRSEHPGTVVKKKGSSGCLITKKKVTDSVRGASGFSDSSSRNLFKSSKKKRRRRVVGSDSKSIDNQSETMRQKVDSFRNGSVVYQAAYLEDEEFGIEKRVSNGLDVFEFDEYDGFDERRIRKDANDGSHRWKLYRRSGDSMESGNGGSGMSADIGSDFHHNKKSTLFATDCSRPTYGAASRSEMEDDESDLPLSVLSKKYRLSSKKPIRLQGKNGVLKVMVNKNKRMGVSRRSSDHAEVEDQKEPMLRVLQKKKLNACVQSSEHRTKDGQSSRSEDTNKNKAAMGTSFYSNSKFAGKPAMSRTKEKGGLKFLKSKLANSSKEINEGDTLMHLKSCSRGEVVKNEGIISPLTENANRIKGKESKVKRGSRTEKQLLREKIKNMLFAAGWTIDYRPRRNRDYLDAVYISPPGTAYWSIIKAYEALQKEEEEYSKAEGIFTPLADEILGKLTRQTRKKIGREMKKKRKSEDSSRNSKKAEVNEVADNADSNWEEEKLNSYVKHSRKSKKNRIEEDSQNSDDDSSENSYNEIPRNDRAAKATVSTNSDTVHGRKSRKIGKCTLLVRSSDKGPYSDNYGLVPYSGKRTLLSWLIDSGVVHMSEDVQYMNSRKTRIMQKGRITKDGIHCGCCSKIVPVLKFELHAGSRLHQPFPNIYLQSGKSLMQCQIDAWNKQGELEQKGFYTVDVDGDDPNDDTCGLCGNGGNLICCDGCPSTFHQSCLDIQMLPQGDWHCPNCSCKYCEIDGGNCTEVCDKNEASLFVCCLCQKKYHESCRPETDLKPTEPNHLNLLFCEQKCQELHRRLQKLFGVKHELDSGFSWSLIRRSDLLTDASSIELSHRVECNSMLAVAMSVMDECFLPIAERRSGTNLIRNVVFNCGSNLGRLNYSGFSTAILERGDEVLCAASIRIHGTQLAEMPFIGTRHIYRRQGLCRRLLSAIESALSSLEVEKLIIPAIAEHMHTWNDVFGFHSLEESHKQELRSMNMLVFPGTDMLQKPLLKRIPKGNNAIEVGGYMALSGKSELISSDKTVATDSGFQDPLEDGFMVETLPINSPVKGAILMPVLVNKSELVSSSSCGNTDDSTNMQYRNGNTGQFSQPDPSCETADVDSHPTQVPGVASHATVSSDIPCEPELQLSVSLDPCFNSNVEESTTQVPAGDLVSELQFPGKESVSIRDLSLEGIGVQNRNGTNLLLAQVHDPSHDRVPTDTPFRSDLQVQVHLEKESFSSVDAHNDSMLEEIYVQNGCETTNNTSDIISLQDQAPKAPSNNSISSDTLGEHQFHSSGLESLETGKYVVVKNKIQISGGKEGSSERNTKEDVLETGNHGVKWSID
ncbi:uncharacterized protein LOC112508160 [Cynara cardunculus var. scolymus]|uniref:Zinc finger, FYVE/PHD-type n=1 Tax=Cynara cardunculus var. scolymus TaxID=59895 RepID=A0A103YLP6_CYNCS|nr:uncharacterized protein LOC112508160 [Cynara cardunculus var. scolymus]XP_024968706.1 uncharacterized protein LOC112508160 [Cynara cardunculus var. scolymus]KVI11332.1 Zinc finger, FYVE/PHD-type [Cynara cardunculus var. scolymus]